MKIIIHSLALLLSLFLLVSAESNQCQNQKALVDSAAELCSSECQLIERSQCLEALTALKQNEECECDQQCEQVISDSYENLVSCAEEEDEEEDEDEMELEEEDDEDVEEDDEDEEDEDEIEDDEDEDEDDLDSLDAKK